uniref:TaqI-like C-terminal specificity domain-containing protein n=1 Tax=Anabaena sp. (strain CA / ATCC 33047) TaxID=52271 RepID=UPI000A96EED6
DNHQALVLNWEAGKTVEEFNSVYKSHSFYMPQKELGADGWRLESPAVLRLLDKLRTAGTPLGEYVNGRFYYGIKTGCNEAFVVDRETRDRLIAEHESSAEVLKPFLRGRDVKRWCVDNPDLWLLFIPWHFPLHEDNSIEGASIKAEKEFKKAYPAIYKHLLSFKNKLLERNQAETGIRYEWYALQRCAATYWQEFDKPKILYQEIATYQAFAWDNSGAYSNNKTFLIPDTNFYVLSLLNSKVIWFFLKNIISKLQGGAYAMQTTYVTQIPIPTAPEADRLAIEILVQKCLDAKGQGVEEWEAEIDDRVAHLYGLTAEEKKIIRGE